MPQYNQSIERAGKILQLFSNAQPILGLSDIAKEIEISKATAHNILSTLEKIGFLKQDINSRKYHLGPQLYAIGSVMAANLDLNQKGAGLAQELAAKYGLVCRLGIWDEDAVLITFSATPFVSKLLSFQAGPRVVAYATAVGRAILAYMKQHEIDKYVQKTPLAAFTPKTKIRKVELLKELSETRNRGFSISNEEMAFDGGALGVPIFNQNSRLVGALSISGNVDHIFGPEMKDIVSSLRSTAIQISRNMGFSPGAPL